MENGQRKQMFDLEEGEEWYDYSDDDGYGLDMDGEENWASESPARVLDPWAHLDVNKMGDDGSMHYGGDERESPVHAGDVSLSGPEEAPDLGLFEPLIRGDDEDDPRDEQAILTSPDDVPSAVITGDALQPIENSPEQPIKIILQEKLQSAMEHITKLKGVYSQDRMLQNVPLIYVPPGQREEYNTLLEQLHPACMDLDLKLPVYFAVVEKEDVVRRLIIIIQTTIHQRMMLFSGSTRFLVTLDTLRTMFQQVLNMSEGIDSMMSGFSFPEDPSHAQSLHTSDSEDQEYGSSDDARSIHSDPSSRHLPLIKEWDRFWTSHLVGIDKSALSGAVIKYLDELERSPDEAFENEPHGIDINLLEVFPSPETVDVLRWLLFSAERLHWTQLADAIAFQGWGRNIYDPSLRNSNTDDIVLCLKSFLAQNHVLSTSLDNSGTPPNAFVVRSRNRPPPIVFAPSPAQQRTTIPPFNHTYDLNPGSSHRFIAIRSIRYLLHFTDHPLDSTTLHKYPLAVYASKYWCHHLLHCDDPTDLLEDAMCLLDDDSGPFIALNHLRTGGSRGKIDWYLPPVSPLCVCSEEGYADGVRALLERGARVDGDYNALLAALRGGHIEIEELLLANGGDLSKERSKLGFSRCSLIRIQILVVQDIDGKSIYLLRKDCMSWEARIFN